MNAPVNIKPFIASWTAGGRVENLADPASLEINFAWISQTLSGLARFNNKQNGPALSVAQHCVQGADALWRETGDSHVAGLFLLHDAHEAWLGDITTPVAKLLAFTIIEHLASPVERYAPEAIAYAIAGLKEEYDAAIYTAANQIPTHLWTGKTAEAVFNMDRRMAEAEALELFGPEAFKHGTHSGLPKPKLTGAICPPWAPMKAEEAFNERLKKYCGIDVRVNPNGAPASGLPLKGGAEKGSKA